LRGFRAFRVEKIAKNLALPDRLQNVAEFLHGLGPFSALQNRADEWARSARKRTSAEGVDWPEADLLSPEFKQSLRTAI
jgi:hypothetical protein